MLENLRHAGFDRHAGSGRHIGVERHSAFGSYGRVG